MTVQERVLRRNDIFASSHNRSANNWGFHLSKNYSGRRLSSKPAPLAADGKKKRQENTSNNRKIRINSRVVWELARNKGLDSGLAVVLGRVRFARKRRWATFRLPGATRAQNRSSAVLIPWRRLRGSSISRWTGARNIHYIKASRRRYTAFDYAKRPACELF